MSGLVNIFTKGLRLPPGLVLSTLKAQGFTGPVGDGEAMCGYLFERVGATLLIVHPEHGCTDAEWDAWIERMGQRDYNAILVVTDGGGPTGAQRARAAEFWKGKDVPRFAVITDSAFVRGILTAFRWLKINDMLPVSPYHTAEAFDYLRTPAAERRLLLERIVTLKTMLHAKNEAAAVERAAQGRVLTEEEVMKNRLESRW